MRQIVFLFVFTAAVAFGGHYARNFSASWVFLIALSALAMLSYRQLKRRFSFLEPVIGGKRANPATLAFFICVAGSYAVYCLGALITGTAGSVAKTRATVMTTVDVRRCDNRAIIKLEDGRTAYYCAGQTLKNGSRVIVRTRSTLLGVYVTRG